MKEVRLLESLGLCQRWLLSVKQDGMHPEQKPLDHLLHLRMWPDGGVTGVLERDNVFNDILGVMERDNVFGDIFGTWNVKSICFIIINRVSTNTLFSGGPHRMIKVS